MTRDLPRWLAISLIFILIAGAGFTWWIIAEKDSQMRQQLLTETRLGAAGISTENLAALTGSDADLNSQDYHLLKDDLIKIRAANPEIRFVYLTGKRPDGEVFFFADSEPPESEDYSPPGQVYTEVSDTFRQVFTTALQTTDGPVTDRWGTWVSGFVPIINPKTGMLVAVLGMDEDARDWNEEIIAAAVVPVLVTGVIESIIVLFVILQQRTERENRRLAASEAAIQKSEEKYRLIAENTADLIRVFDLDLHLKYISPSVTRIRGFTIEEAMLQTFDQMMTPESRESVSKCFHDEIALESDATADPERTFTLETSEFRKDGSTILMESTLKILRDADHQPTGIIGISHDITERKHMEKVVLTSLKEKEILLKEIHHRVKNNLQIVISLLNLQSRYIDDEKSAQIIKESQTRIRAMSLVHEKLYQSANIAKINLDDYVRFLGNSLFQFYGMDGRGVTFNTTIPDVNLGINAAIPIGLMINELISNSLKYAFPGGRRGEISVAITQKDHVLTMVYKDTGIGIPQDFDWRNAKSLGLRLIISLVEQLQGTIELDRTAGTKFTIVVKEKD
jgi:PAS domain S-box-containing protein